MTVMMQMMPVLIDNEIQFNTEKKDENYDDKVNNKTVMITVKRIMTRIQRNKKKYIYTFSHRHHILPNQINSVIIVYCVTYHYVSLLVMVELQSAVSYEK